MIECPTCFAVMATAEAFAKHVRWHKNEAEDARQAAIPACKRCKGSGRQPGLHNACGRCWGTGKEAQR